MGRRFGSDKQIDPVGPAGEPLGAYTAFDARAADFGELVLVTRPGAEADVGAVFVGALGDVPIRCVPQRYPFPPHTSPPVGRTRPWGTAHATLAAAATIDGSFAVANADDAYGLDALAALRRALSAAAPDEVVLVTYPAGDVLSSAGGVSRGWVRTNADGIVEVLEVHDLRRTHDGTLEGVTEEGETVELDQDTPVSMNLWGLTSGAVAALREGWVRFVHGLARAPDGPLLAEFGLSTALTELARAGRVTLRPVAGGMHWFGMTFADDRARVVARLAELHADGTYPPSLFRARVSATNTPDSESEP